MDNPDANLTPDQIFDQEVAAAESSTPAEPVEAPQEPVEAVAPATQAPAEPPPANDADKVMQIIGTLEQRVRNAEGQVGGLKSQLQAFQKAALEQPPAMPAATPAPSAEQLAEAGTDSEKWKQFKEDFPEWGNAIEERLARTAAPAVNIDEILAKERAEFERKRAEDRAAFEVRLVSLRHPDWRETTKTPEWHAWRIQQPADVQALADSDKADDAIRMLDLYAEHRAKQAQSRQERETRLEAAADIPVGRGAAAPTNKRVEDMTDVEYFDYLAAQK